MNLVCPIASFSGKYEILQPGNLSLEGSVHTLHSKTYVGCAALVVMKCVWLSHPSDDKQAAVNTNVGAPFSGTTVLILTAMT